MIYGTEHPPQHIRHDEVSDMAASDVDLLEMRHTAVTRSHCDIFELDVHVIFGCVQVSNTPPIANYADFCHTFQKLSTVDLARSDFQSDNVALVLLAILDTSLATR